MDGRGLAFFRQVSGVQAMFSVKLKIAIALVFVVVVLGWPGQGAPPAAAWDDVGGNGKAAPSDEQIIYRSGSLKAVDAVNRTVTLALSPKGVYTYKLAKDVKVLIADGKKESNITNQLSDLKLNYRSGTLADLQDGALVVTANALSTKLVVTIWVVGPTISGVLGAVDVKKSTITLTVPNKKGAGAQETTYRVAKDAAVFIDGKEAKYEDLVTEVNVRLTLSGDLKEAGRISAVGPTFNGFLKSVDAEKNSITLTIAEKKSDPGVAKTFALAGGVKVLIYGQETDVKKLAPGTRLSLKLSGHTKEVTTIATMGRIEMGMLDAVDPVNNTITLFYGKLVPGQTKSFKMLKVPQITLSDGKSGKLSDLKIEDQVMLWFAWDQPEVVVAISYRKQK
jgi:hypothetical protein